MDEKVIEFNQEKYLVTTGELKLIEGNFTKEELSKIYELRDSINIVNQEINAQKEKLKYVHSNKEVQRKIPKLRMCVILAYVAATIFIAINETITHAVLVAIIYAMLHCCIEKFMETLFGTKKQNELEENNINNSLDNKNQQLKEYKKELTEIIEKTKYQEKTLNEETTIRPIDHSLDNVTLKVSNLSRVRKLEQ